MLNIILGVGKVNKDIAKENQEEFVQVLTKKSIHHIHKLGKETGDTKRHDQKFVEPPPHLKCSFINIFWLYQHLPIPWQKIDSTENLGTPQPVKQFLW